MSSTQQIRFTTKALPLSALAQNVEKKPGHEQDEEEMCPVLWAKFDPAHGCYTCIVLVDEDKGASLTARIGVDVWDKLPEVVVTFAV